MTAPETDRSYILPAHIRWVQDSDSVIVVDDLNRRGLTLRGVEAATWSWLSLSYSYARLVKLLAQLLGVPAPEAAARLHATLDGWRAQGLLILSREGNDG